MTAPEAPAQNQNVPQKTASSMNAKDFDKMAHEAMQILNESKDLSKQLSKMNENDGKVEVP